MENSKVEDEQGYFDEDGRKGVEALGSEVSLLKSAVTTGCYVYRTRWAYLRIILGQTAYWNVPCMFSEWTLENFTSKNWRPCSFVAIAYGLEICRRKREHRSYSGLAMIRKPTARQGPLAFQIPSATEPSFIAVHSAERIGGIISVRGTASKAARLTIETMTRSGWS